MKFMRPSFEKKNILFIFGFKVGQSDPIVMKISTGQDTYHVSVCTQSDGSL